MKTSAVSFTGDKRTRDALKLLATERQTTVGVLVAAAIEEKYGEELRSIASFFQGRDCISSHLTVEKEHV